MHALPQLKSGALVPSYQKIASPPFISLREANREIAIKNNMDKPRQADIALLEKGKKTAHDPESKLAIEKAEHKIKEQLHDGYIQSARNSLIREAQAGRTGNVRDITEEMHKPKVSWGKTSFFFGDLD